MLPKSEASPYILTLILSFVLSDLLSNLTKDKLKPYISYGLVSPHLENPADFPLASICLESSVTKPRHSPYT